MEHDEKIQHLIGALRERRVGRYSVAPPLYRLLWRLGWKVRPPLFQGFIALFLVQGTVFGVLMALVLWVVRSQSPQPWAEFQLAYVAIAAALFGLLMALHCRWRAGVLGLGEWEQYPDS